MTGPLNRLNRAELPNLKVAKEPGLNRSSVSRWRSWAKRPSEDNIKALTALPKKAEKPKRRKAMPGMLPKTAKTRGDYQIQMLPKENDMATWCTIGVEKQREERELRERNASLLKERQALLSELSELRAR